MTLPKAYSWLADEPGPRLLKEFLKIYGTAETAGLGNTPEILRWADRVGLGHVYREDAVAWCGLAMGYVALQAGWDVPVNLLWARSWLTWGTEVEKPMLGDVLVFSRGPVNGHVGIYVGEDRACYHVLGGNQSDRVSIKRIEKTRLIQERRCPWRVNQPVNVRVVKLSPVGEVSKKEY
jgi:uncharacterized protein (TIGR02594 family)